MKVRITNWKSFKTSPLLKEIRMVERLILIKCKRCNRIRKFGEFIDLTEAIKSIVYDKDLYDLHIEETICDDCEGG